MLFNFPALPAQFGLVAQESANRPVNYTDANSPLCTRDLGESDFVDVVFHRASAFEGDFRGLLSGCVVDFFPAQKILRLGHTPGGRCHTAEDYPGIARHAAIALNNGRDTHDGMIPGEPLANFVVEAFAAGFRIGNKDLCDDIAGFKNVFMFKIYLRQHEEFFQRQNSSPRYVDNFDLRVEGHQNGREIGRMDNETRASAEYGVIAAIARY